MTKKRLTKTEIALRQELANAIHDMDDGNLNSSRLHNLIGKINNKLYHENDSSYEEDIDNEEPEEVLPSISYDWESYTDNMEYLDIDSLYDECDTGEIYGAIEELAYSTDVKKVPKRLKKVEEKVAKYVKHVKSLEKDFSADIKKCVSSATKQLERLKKDVAKDLKPKKENKNGSKQKTLL